VGRSPTPDTGDVLDVDGLLADLQAAVAEAEPRLAVRDVLTRAVARPAEAADALRPEVGGLRMLYRSVGLTVVDAAWAPGMRLMPHDHRMWAVIGVYQGAEDNEFFRRGTDRPLVESGGRRLAAGDVVVLGESTIHAVANPTSGLTGGLHVYGGDFVAQPRSQWGPGDPVERPFDLDEALAQFHEANVAAGLVDA